MWHDAVNALLASNNINLTLNSYVNVIGKDPVFDTPHRVGEAAAIALATAGVLVNELSYLQTKRHQTFKVNVTDAAISLKSVFYLSQRGYPIPFSDPVYPTINFFETRDGRFIFTNGGYPALRDGLLKLLSCSHDTESIARAVKQFDAQTLEDVIAEKALCGVIARTKEEWQNHPEGQVLLQTPVVEIVKIADSPPQPIPPGTRLFSKLRALDLTHALAGPVCTRYLAELGGQVLRIMGPGRPVLPPFLIDTGHGKLSAFLDLKQKKDANIFRDLLKDADVLAESYRPGVMDRLGLSPEKVADIRPGIIYVSVRAYSHNGPWNNRAGWEQLAQVATGMAMAQGTVSKPQLSPVFPCDYITGYLATYGILAALLRRTTEGGSYAVRVSLCRTAMWIQSLGPVAREPRLPETEYQQALSRLMMSSITPFGLLKHLRPISQFSETKPYYVYPTPTWGQHEPQWPLTED